MNEIELINESTKVRKKGINKERQKERQKEINLWIFLKRNRKQDISCYAHPDAVPVQIVGQIDGDEHTRGTRVDTHVVRRVVEELGSGVTLHVVRIVVTPSKLDVDPILLGRSRVHNVSGEREKEGEEEEEEEEKAQTES